VLLVTYNKKQNNITFPLCHASEMKVQ